VESACKPAPIAGLKCFGVKYKVVKRPHVVPRGYLRGFGAGEIISMHLIEGAAPRDVPIAKAGVLKGFYRRERPDGTPIYDIDWSLDHIDKVAPAILRQVAERWPLDMADKALLAEFIGTQLVRGPRWRDWHLAFNDDYFDEVRSSGQFRGLEPEGQSYEDALAEQKRILDSDTAVLTKMLSYSAKTTQVLGSMHWTLVGFPRPWLATSDHPVILWPLDVRSRQPTKTNVFARGITKTLEARFPLSARHALLMTWLDLPDDEATVVRGDKEAAANMNAFTVGEAEHQWYHLPGVSVPRASGQLLPLSTRLLRPYDSRVANESARRREIYRRMQRKIGQDTLGSGFELVTVSSSKTIGVVQVDPPPDDELRSGAA
jgi:hypothetical protein